MEWGIAMTAATLFGMLVLFVAAVRMDDVPRSGAARTGPDFEAAAPAAPARIGHGALEALKQAA